MIFDSTLNSLGQDYFRAGVLLVGNTTYANHRTDGVDDQVQLQAAIDAAALASGAMEVRIISDLNVNFALSETVGGSISRRIACQLKDYVKVTIAAGCTISFPSGGNSGGSAFTSVFGNWGNLQGAEVICEGINSFDGLSSTSGTSTDRHSAVWLDARSQSCSLLQDINLVISGKRTSGDMVRTYNATNAGATLAKNIQIQVKDSRNCHTALLVERKGSGIHAYIKNAQNTIADGAIFKDGVKSSSLTIDSLTNAGTNGIKLFIDPTIDTEFNDLKVKINNVQSSGLNNIFIQGLDGALEANSTLAQQAGILIATVSSGGTTYYPSKLIVSNTRSLNNNQSASTYSGIQGITKNVVIISSDFSDTQGSPTQKYGIDFSDVGNDYIEIIGTKAEGNVTDQILCHGVNSHVAEDVIGFARVKTLSAAETYTVVGPEDTYILNSASVLKLPKFSSFGSSNSDKKYKIKAIDASSRVEATQENDLSYKAFDSMTAGKFLQLTKNMSMEIAKTPTQWRTFQRSHPQLAGIALSANATMTSAGFYTVDTSSDRSHILPDAQNIQLEPIILKKITRDFNVATFTRAGSTTIEAHNNPLTTPTSTSIALALPDEVVELWPLSNNTFRRRTNRNLSQMYSCAYRGGSINQGIAGLATVDLAFWTTFDDKIKAIDANYGIITATNFWFRAPIDGVVEFNMSGSFISTSGTTLIVRQRLSTDNGASWLDVAETPTIAVAAGASATAEAKIVNSLTVLKNDLVKYTAYNNTASSASLFSPAAVVAARAVPALSYTLARYIGTTY